MNRSSSAPSRPIRIRPSSTPIVAGTAPAARTAASLARPISTPSGAGNPCATSVVSSATTARSSSSAVCTSSVTRIRSCITREPSERFGSPPSGIAPASCTQRAAASSARSGPPTSQPAANASPAPVVSTTLDRHGGALVAVERGAGGAALQDPRRAGERPADDLLLVLVREHDVRGERFELRPEPLGAEVPDRAPRREVDADPRAVARGALDRAASPRSGPGSRSSA